MFRISARRAGSRRERGLTLIELCIATLVLSVGLIALARLFVLATLNAALAVNISQGINDAQRLIEVYKTEAAINGATSSAIVSGTYSQADSGSAYYNAMLINGGTGYRSVEFQEDVWVFDQSGTLVTGTYTTNPTLSFQLARGFHVFDVVHGYLQHDPESLGWAALIQWINPAVATPEDYGVSDPRLAAYMPRVAV